jgi:hypothetical protein
MEQIERLEISCITAPICSEYLSMEKKKPPNTNLKMEEPHHVVAYSKSYHPSKRSKSKRDRKGPAQDAVACLISVLRIKDHDGKIF